MNLVLCGMPGSGKTTVGALLSRRLARKFWDTDEMISSKYGEIAEIFARFGEERFRSLERDAVEALRGLSDAVIATGGGLVTDESSVGILKQNGKIIYLHASVQTLCRRLEYTEPRPLLSGDLRGNLKRLLQARGPTYERIADIVVPTESKSAEEVAEEIIKKTGEFL